MVKSNDKKETKAKTNSKARSKTKAKTVSKAKSTSKAKSDKKTTNKWGFLAPTREKAKEMEAKYGVHFTPLIDYMNVIFPDVDDWEEERLESFGVDYKGKELYFKPDLISDSDHKLIVIGNRVALCDEEGNSIHYRISVNDASDCAGCEVFRIDCDTQLTNATVKQIFGVEVKEPLFDENTPTITQPWVFNILQSSAESRLKGKYVGDEKQYQVNFEAYKALFDNIGLSKIIVKKLFGLYDYEIGLNTNSKISILIGPNGCGKTTLLKIVRFMLSGIGDSNEIAKVPFGSITCVFANGRKKKLQNSNGKLSYFIDDKKVESFEKIAFSQLENLFFRVELITAQRLLGKVADNVDEQNENNMSVSQYIDTISRIKDNFKHFCEETEKAYNENNSRQEHHLFNRYVRSETDELDDLVFEKEWNDFSKRRYECEENKALNSKFSAHRLDNDGTELYNLFHNNDYNEYNDDIIKLYKNGNKKEFLCLYLKMFKYTLYCTEKAHKKTMMFQRIINDRFKITQKQLQYRFGEMYLTIGEGKNKKEIPLDVLSSGEKNDFIMFYNLIFNCKNSKVFIDEPAISLHIEWQERFINDLSEICEMNNIQALVATHSPNIINDHTDLIANWEIKDGR